MIIQIFGTNKCKETQKAVRFFKERKMTPHLVDLNEKALSKGELENISRAVGMENMLDKNSKEFKRLQLEFKIYDLEEKILEYPLLLKTPIVRNGKKSTLGYEPDIWKKWIDDEKKK